MTLNAAKSRLAGSTRSRWGCALALYAILYCSIYSVQAQETPSFFGQEPSYHVPLIIGMGLIMLGLLGLVAFLGLDQRKRRLDIQVISSRLESLITSIPDMVYFKDVKGRYIVVNKAFEEFAGTSSDQMVGQTDIDLLPPELAAHCRNSDADALRSKHPVRSEEYMTNSKGESVIFETLKTPITNDTGKITGLVGVSRDITDRRKASDALTQSETRYRRLAEGAEDIIFVISKHLTAEYANCAATLFLNKPLQEIVGQSVNALFPPDIASTFKKALLEAITTGVTVSRHHSFPSSTGTAWLDTKLVPIEGSEGTIISVLGISRDITEARNAQDQVKISEARYRGVVEDMPVFVCRFSPDGKLTFVNKTYRSYFRKTEEELIGHSFMPMIPEEDREMVENMFGSLSAENPVVTYEHRTIMPDGEIRWLNWIDRALCDAEGQVVEYQSIGSDTTERHRTEQALLRSHNRLRALTARLQRLQEEESKRMATMIHDELGQALTAVKMNATWFKKHLSEEDEDVHRRAREMESLVDMSIKAVQGITMQLRPTMLDHLGLKAAAEWAIEEFEKRSGTSTSFDVEGDVDIAHAEKATSIFRILQELLTNVARHADARHVDVSLRVQNDQLTLEVKDDGRGITEEDTSRPTSFGITEVRERSMYWGGTTHIEGRPDEGTIITVAVPVNSVERRND